MNTPKLQRAADKLAVALGNLLGAELCGHSVADMASCVKCQGREALKDFETWKTIHHYRQSISSKKSTPAN